jgi:transcription-repair coupling factor (superfamily II helicase)
VGSTLTFDEREIIDFKISLAKDLEKKIKMGYQSQFRNIVISITSMPKRYKKLKANINVSEDTQKLETISKNIYNYLLDMFDVFGDNAVLNAKRIFEESGTKWGKKFYKSFNQRYNAGDAKKLTKELYLNLNDIDYINSTNRQINWVFKKPEEDSSLSSRSSRYFNILYEVKAIWLQNFIKAVAPGYIGVMEIVEENENQIITNIMIKEGI